MPACTCSTATRFEIYGVGFAGVKGFAGGFGRRALGPWGEQVIKLFVQEALDEALKLETALGRLRTERRVVLLHYSPIAGTVEGEPLEIYPYLGSSRLEEPLTRYPVDVVFHGHAHHGTRGGPDDGRRAGLQRVDVAAAAELARRPAVPVVELGRQGAEIGAGRDPLRRADRPRALDRRSPFPPGTPSSVIARRSSTSSSSSPLSSPFFVTSSFTVSPVAIASLASLAASA